MRLRPKVKRTFRNFFIIVILVGILGFVATKTNLLKFDSIPGYSKTNEIDEEAIRKLQEQKQLEEYNNCLSEVALEIDTTEVDALVEELNTYIQDNYKASILYEDLTYGYTYSYNPKTVYYGASTIKSLDALYIYTKAAAGEIDLNHTLTYTEDYVAGSSQEMGKKVFGTRVSLRNLVKYAVEVSDNSAHFMLLDYIGFNNLREFGKSLGATTTLSGVDRFGNLNANDGVIYMKAINEFINSNGDLGKELQTYFLNAEQNDLNLEEFNILAAHKYGEYNPNYHDIGIVYAEHPYVVAILTKEMGHSDFEDRVKDINYHVYELHQAYYNAREEVCKTRVYGS